MRKILLGFCFLATLISCSEKSEPPANTKLTPAEAQLPATYIEHGDIAAIKSHQSIRFIAPRFDGADALPRDGIPVQHYQVIAEAFAKQLELNAEWVFIDDFDQLIPTLNAGKGDIVITNLSITKDRAEVAAFTRPINLIDEVTITKTENPILSFEDLSQKTIAVPSGTAYVETVQTVQKTNNLEINLITAPASSSDSDMLSAVQNGQYDATVLDSDVAQTLLLDYPDLSSGLTLRKNRKIAWAVRPNNPELLRLLNEFLVSHYLETTANQASIRDWQAIKQSGRLRMLTLNNPASYFMWRGELVGFDLDLMKEFAKQHKLHVSVILKDSISELIAALKAGEGDVIAASLTRTPEREQQGILFSKPYLKISEKIIGLTSTPPLNHFEELAGKTVGANPDTVYFSRFKELVEQGIPLEIKTYPETTSENLIDNLSQGEFDYAAIDSHLLAIEQTHRDDIEAKLEFNSKVDIAWAVRPGQSELVEKLNQFISKEYRGLIYNVTFNKYFKNSRKIKRFEAGRLTKNTDLSPYDELVKKEADKYGLDWRLLVSQMYQESKFNPKAKSFAGAQGLMQVMPRTAKEFGFSSLDVPENGIAAGIAYMNWLEKRFPGQLELQERIFFTLAAYNAGPGHVRDARKLARQLGKNPDKWFGNVEQAMLLLSKPQYYKKARFGYVRGKEPVNYVKEIQERYLGYLQVN